MKEINTCCDLHCHSTYSDGSCTPESLVQLAVATGLAAVALTDHNTIDGHDAFLRAAAGRIEPCLGCEFSTEVDGQELHLLGLFLDVGRVGAIQRELSLQIRRKEEANRCTIERLVSAGYPLNYAEFIQTSGVGSRNRVHIAKYLMQKGIVKSVEEAFAGLLARDSAFVCQSSKMNFYEMIKKINDAGGVSVWAHPLVDVDRCTCRAILQRAKLCGLDGVEVRHSDFSAEEVTFMEALCHELQLLPSGGSDFHGAHKPDISIGKGRGDLSVPYDWYIALKRRAEARR